MPIGAGSPWESFCGVSAQHGLAQAALAERFGFDQSYVSQVESEGREIRDRDALRLIAEVLVVAPEDLGLSRSGGPREGSALDAGAQAVVARSQRKWRIVREHLNRSRQQLIRAAARMYDRCSTRACRAPLLVRTNRKTLQRCLGRSRYPRHRRTLPLPA